jgi:zinc transport system substrate-binding protein
MKNPLCAALAVCIAIAFSACPGRTGSEAAGKVKIVSSIFVLYDVTRTIGGEYASATLFLPPGAEPHTYEPTARDIMALKAARVFFYTGGLMEPWAERVLASVGGPELLAVDVTKGMDLLTAPDEGAAQADPGSAAPGRAGAAVDPHFWLDPQRLLPVADAVAGALSQADPAHAPDYAARAAVVKSNLIALDAEIRAGLAGRRQDTLVFGGHNTFGYFGARYGLSIVSPYEGFSPAAEPQARKLVELAARMKRSGLSVIYFGEGVDPRLARVLAGSVNGRLVLLHGAHNVSREEMAAGVTYFSIMRDNLAKLKADPGLFPR